MSAEAKPKKKLAIISCMDTRLVNFLSENLNIKRGDAKVLKNAGNIITEDTVRSLVISVYLLDVEKIMVVGHTDCGMKSVDVEDIKRKMVEREASEKKRYKEIYNIDLDDLSIYDLVIDTSKWDVEGVFNIVSSAIDNLIQK